MREQDGDAVRAIHRRSFNVPREVSERIPPPRLEDTWVAEEKGTVVGSARINRWAHFYGGRSVPGTGVSGVVVAPEARGKQVAEQLVVTILRELRDAFPISTLYPATVPLYRRCGYEYAGLRVRFRAQLRLLPRSSGALECEPFEDSDLDDVAGCYESFARTTNGLIDRPRSVWTDRLFVSFENEEIYRALVRENGRVTGYVVYTQSKHQGVDFGYDLDTRDLVWTTPAAARALLTFAGRHRSVGYDLLWTGPAMDPLSQLLSEQDAKHQSWFRPMLRLAEVPAAFEARGYPAHLETAVELAVNDPSFEHNNGGWRIEVSGGQAKVVPASDAAARVDVVTLAALWSNALRAADARRLGRLDADDATVASLEEMFAGPEPWILDWF